MSRNLVRAAATGCGLLVIVIRLLYAFNLELRRPLGLSLLGAFVAEILVPFGLFAAVTWRAHAHRGLRVDAARGRFIADRTPWLTYLGLGMFVAAAGSIPVERVPNTDRMRLYTDPGVLSAAGVFLVLYLTVGVTAIMINRPRVVLDRDGISVDGILPSQRLAWTDTMTYSAYLDRRNRWLYMQTAAPDPEKVKVAKVPVGWLDVDPILLQQAVRTYTDQPERRDEIGTEAESARLASDARTAVASSP